MYGWRWYTNDVLSLILFKPITAQLFSMATPFPVISILTILLISARWNASKILMKLFGLKHFFFLFGKSFYSKIEKKKVFEKQNGYLRQKIFLKTYFKEKFFGVTIFSKKCFWKKKIFVKKIFFLIFEKIIWKKQLFFLPLVPKRPRQAHKPTLIKCPISPGAKMSCLIINGA